MIFYLYHDLGLTGTDGVGADMQEIRFGSWNFKKKNFVNNKYINRKMKKILT